MLVVTGTQMIKILPLQLLKKIVAHLLLHPFYESTSEPIFVQFEKAVLKSFEKWIYLCLPKQHLELSINSCRSYSHPDITGEPNVNKV